MEQSKEQSKEQMIEQYLEQLTKAEKVAYQIAVKKLETSFCIEKSIGFLKFMDKHQ